LPVVLYGYETLWLPKRDELRGGWRKLHMMSLLSFPSRQIIIRMSKSRRMTWAGHVARFDEKTNAYRGLNWIHLTQDKDQCRPLINIVRTFGFHNMLGNSLVSERLLASQERLGPIIMI
jgi:hypothetical protein